MKMAGRASWGTLKKGQPSFGVPSTRIAEQLGRTIVQNIVMLGFFAAVTKIVPLEDMRSAVRDSVPPGTEELNLRAFDAGWEHFEKEYGDTAAPKKAPAKKKATTKKTKSAAAGAAG